MAIKRVGVASLKNNLSRHLREVEAGSELEITDHDRPIARLIPIQARGAIAIRRATKPFKDVAQTRYSPLTLPISSTELLRQDRDRR